MFFVTNVTFKMYRYPDIVYIFLYWRKRSRKYWNDPLVQPIKPDISDFIGWTSAVSKISLISNKPRLTRLLGSYDMFYWQLDGDGASGVTRSTHNLRWLLIVNDCVNILFIVHPISGQSSGSLLETLTGIEVGWNWLLIFGSCTRCTTVYTVNLRVHILD